MFTNAGMLNQFKDTWGTLRSKTAGGRFAEMSARVGQHNDLEEVVRHLPSHDVRNARQLVVRDYFKKEAISWAWELLTDVYGLPKERLYATIFEESR